MGPPLKQLLFIAVIIGKTIALSFWVFHKGKVPFKIV